MGSSCSIDKGDNAGVAKKETVESTPSTCEQHQQPQNHIHFHKICTNQSRVHGNIKVHDAMEKCAAEDGDANPLKLPLCATTTTVVPSTCDENNYSCDESPQNIVYQNEWARILRTLKEKVSIVIHIPHTKHSEDDVALSSDDDEEEEERAKEDDASSPCYAPSNTEVIAPPPPRCRGSSSFSSTSSSSSSP
ncbi:Hypothetical protein, putative [Bodo saltans]|uniref:Uncharacterized protein n=1 Tax=Bodo saltans TaxID=75058 RepID=A0A0S4IVH0_BODSA|nr:Hypothetical protein, putative [Bodo saltans]|eukprot:CUG18976.1 Hypothetical protein, putative [Bodo saltans]